MTLFISRTAPFRKLQSRIGSATYRLNTILVGLEFIANGGDKTAKLAVTWKKPSFEKANEVATQAQIFACSAALALASDVFDQFLRDISRESWLQFDDQTIAIATKSVTRPDSDGGDYSVAERAETILADLKITEPELLAGIDLFAKWRNVVVHSAKRNAKVDDRFERTLASSQIFFHDNFSHLDMRLALTNFMSRKIPVPKEVTSLIAMAQRVSRRIDEEAIKRAAGSSASMERSVDAILQSYFSYSRRSISATREIAEAWQGPIEKRRAKFLKILQQLGVANVKSPVSAALRESYITEATNLTPQAAMQRFGQFAQEDR